jgi:large subunit ribosomal protein L5
MAEKDYIKEWAEKPMTKPRVSQVVLNIGVGSEGDKLGSAMDLLEKLTGRKPVNTYSKHKIPAWGLRKGLPIGAKVTLRREAASDFLKKALFALDNSIKARNFDDVGNLSFGIEQYVFFEGIKYDPKIGTMGLQLSATIERPGVRIKRRGVKKSKPGKKHRVSKEESIIFIKKEFNVDVDDE